MEKRIFTRVANVFPITLKFSDPSNKTLDSSGETVNVSEMGLCIALGNPLPMINTAGTISVNSTPKYPSFEADVQLIWKSAESKKTKTFYGVRFLGLKEKQIDTLKNILSDSKKRTFVFEKTVYLCDTNAEGNVYFARYFDWQGMAREEFVKVNVPSLFSILQSGVKLITVEAHAEYKNESLLYDKILIGITIRNLKKASLDLIFTYRNKENNKLIATGWEKLAFADKSGNLIPIPDDIRENAKYFLIEE